MSEEALHVPIIAKSWSVSREWSRLDDSCLGVFDCPHTTPKLTDEGPYVVRSQDIRGRVFDYRNAGRVSEETYADRIARAEPEFGDLLYSREGTYFGIAAEIPQGMRVCLGQRMVLIRPDKSKLDHRFLLYWLNSPDMEGHLGGFRDGSVAERLNMTTIRALPIPLPPLAEQREIAGVLGALDDKIEANRKASACLEEMARALYRSWFVNFDPVHAKSQNRPPAHMDPTTAALFPDRFSENGLPEGWEISTIGDVAEIVGGATPKSKEPTFWVGGHHLWATPKDLSTLNQPVLFDTARKVTDAGLEKISSRLSPAGTLLLSSRAPIGYLAIAAAPVAVNQGFIAIRETEEISGLEAYFWCAENMELIHGNANGSTFQEISKKNFRPMEYALAPKPIREAFNAQAGVWFERLSLLCKENQTLATLRDTLLPRLMSGTLRVKAVVAEVEAVV